MSDNNKPGVVFFLVASVLAVCLVTAVVTGAAEIFQQVASALPSTEGLR